jgi:hypothetical protein
MGFLELMMEAVGVEQKIRTASSVGMRPNASIKPRREAASA